MEGVRLNREELIEKFGISQRLAVRVGALLAKRVQITAAVLETATPGSPMERLLTRPELLSEVETLSTERLAELAREAGVLDQGPFAVVEEGGWHIIALEEERLAEEGFKTAASHAQQETALVRPETAPFSPTIFRPKEAQELFTSEEIARLKLDALTSADPVARTSAIRRLQFAPISREEKGSIYLKVLLDPISPVRSEAVRALGALGFDQDTAEAVKSLFEGDERSRQLAIERIGVLFNHLPPSQQQVVLAVLGETLREIDTPSVLDRIFEVLAMAAPVAATSPQYLRDIVKTSVAKVVADHQQNGRHVRRFLLEVGKHAPNLLADWLLSELESLREPEIRIFMLVVLSQMELDISHKETLARIMAKDLARMKGDEVSLQKLGHNLTALGEPAAAPLLEEFLAGTSKQKAFLAPFLDNLALDRLGDVAFQNRVAEALLNCMRVGEKRVRLAIMRCRVLTRRQISSAIRSQVAAELVQELSAYEHPDILDRVSDMLEALGETAVESLFKSVRNDPYSLTSDRAMRVLGRIIGASSSDEWQRMNRAMTIIRFARKCLDDPKVKIGGYAYALGHICANAACPQSEAEELMDILRQKIGKCPYQADVLDALGRLAASPHSSLPRRIELARFFAELMRRQPTPEEEVVKETETVDGKLYEFGGRAEFDSVILPVVVASLERIVLSEHASPALRHQIITEMLEVWEGVASWTIIWGPRSTEALSSGLARIACSPHTATETRLRIGRALQTQVSRLTVVRALGELCMTTDSSSEMNILALDIGEAILAEWADAEMVDEEREIIFKALSRIAARQHLPPRSPRVRRFRENVLQRLFDALREGSEWARPALETIRDCPTLPKPMHQEIAERLSQGVALMRSGS